MSPPFCSNKHKLSYPRGTYFEASAAAESETALALDAQARASEELALTRIAFQSGQLQRLAALRLFKADDMQVRVAWDLWRGVAPSEEAPTLFRSRPKPPSPSGVDGGADGGADGGVDGAADGRTQGVADGASETSAPCGAPERDGWPYSTGRTPCDRSLPKAASPPDTPPTPPPRNRKFSGARAAKAAETAAAQSAINDAGTVPGAVVKAHPKGLRTPSVAFVVALLALVAASLVASGDVSGPPASDSWAAAAPGLPVTRSGGHRTSNSLGGRGRTASPSLDGDIGLAADDLLVSGNGAAAVARAARKESLKRAKERRGSSGKATGQRKKSQPDDLETLSAAQPTRPSAMPSSPSSMVSLLSAGSTWLYSGGNSPAQLVLALAAWGAAALWLHRAGWRYPVIGGALVALGTQEVVENVASFIEGEQTAHTGGGPT